MMLQTAQNFQASSTDVSALSSQLEQIRQHKGNLTSDRVLGMFCGVTLGDALGLPYETMTPADLQGKNLNRLISPITYNPYLQNKGYTNLVAGRTSDDTQLTLGVAVAIIAPNQFEPARMVDHHVREREFSAAGWGGSVNNGLNQYQKTGRWNFRAELPDNAPGAGLGNGVTIKLSPLAPYLAMSSFDGAGLLRLISDLTVTTHPTNISAVASLTALCAFPDF